MSERTLALDARCISAQYRAGWTLKGLAVAHGVSKATIHRLVKSTGTPMRRPGQVVIPMLAPAPPEPVIDYGGRFAYSGRCGVCLSADCHGDDCAPVRVTTFA